VSWNAVLTLQYDAASQTAYRSVEKDRVLTVTDVMHINELIQHGELPEDEIPRKQFPRSILVANVARMSLTCHEEIGRVGRVGQECYEDASDLSTTNVERVGHVEFGEHTTHGQQGSTTLQQTAGRPIK